MITVGFTAENPENQDRKASLLQLSYKSRLTVVGRAQDVVIKEILRASVLANANQDITGWMLLDSRNGEVFQILEGPPVEVEKLWSKLLKDPRHNIEHESVLRRSTQHREFPHWYIGIHPFFSNTKSDPRFNSRSHQ